MSQGYCKVWINQMILKTKMKATGPQVLMTNLELVDLVHVEHLEQGDLEDLMVVQEVNLDQAVVDSRDQGVLLIHQGDHLVESVHHLMEMGLEDHHLEEMDLGDNNLERMVQGICLTVLEDHLVEITDQGGNLVVVDLVGRSVVLQEMVPVTMENKRVSLGIVVLEILEGQEYPSIMMGPGDLLIMKDQGDPSIMMDPGDLSTMKDQEDSLEVLVPEAHQVQEECKGDQEDHQMSSRIKTLEGQDQEALDQEDQGLEDQGLEDQDQEVDHHNLDNLVMDLGDQLLQAPVMQEMVLEILAQEGPTIILLVQAVQATVGHSHLVDQVALVDKEDQEEALDQEMVGQEGLEDLEILDQEDLLLGEDLDLAQGLWDLIAVGQVATAVQEDLVVLEVLHLVEVLEADLMHHRIVLVLKADSLKDHPLVAVKIIKMVQRD